MKIDLDNLTLGEIAKFEDLSNQSIAVLGDNKAPKGRAMAALVFIVKRRTGDPKFTWAEAQNVTMPEAQEILGIEDDSDDEPSEEAPKAPQKKPSPKK